MKSTMVTGKYLNEKLGNEAEIYLNGRFNEEKEYQVYEDGCVDDEHGHQVAENFVIDEVLFELNLIEKKFYVCDKTNNTGKDYISENGTNVSLVENAKQFDTKEEAEEWLKNFNFESDPDEWAVIVEE
jgi:hypothetical protein